MHTLLEQIADAIVQRRDGFKATLDAVDSVSSETRGSDSEMPDINNRVHALSIASFARAVARAPHLAPIDQCDACARANLLLELCQGYRYPSLAIPVAVSMLARCAIVAHDPDLLQSATHAAVQTASMPSDKTMSAVPLANRLIAIALLLQLLDASIEATATDLPPNLAAAALRVSFSLLSDAQDALLVHSQKPHLLDRQPSAPGFAAMYALSALEQVLTLAERHNIAPSLSGQEWAVITTKLVCILDSQVEADQEHLEPDKIEVAFLCCRVLLQRVPFIHLLKNRVLKSQLITLVSRSCSVTPRNSYRTHWALRRIAANIALDQLVVLLTDGTTASQQRALELHRLLSRFNNTIRCNCSKHKVKLNKAAHMFILPSIRGSGSAASDLYVYDCMQIVQDVFLSFHKRTCCQDQGPLWGGLRKWFSQ
ncbi:hypothetical protein BJ741DRAFT_619732 [Chytriomyces cf. hyalinus JEL632]|nr:hypothetical protein BJ741DRAFT_619732 [Chytriomyces cf. hyalinus JEL632]